MAFKFIQCCFKMCFSMWGYIEVLLKQTLVSSRVPTCQKRTYRQVRFETTFLGKKTLHRTAGVPLQHLASNTGSSILQRPGGEWLHVQGCTQVCLHCSGSKHIQYKLQRSTKAAFCRFCRIRSSCRIRSRSFCQIQKLLFVQKLLLKPEHLLLPNHITHILAFKRCDNSSIKGFNAI